MKITHNIVNYLGESKIYLYIEIADEFEFGKDFETEDYSDNVFSTIKNYVKKLKFSKQDIALLIINGVLIGSISLSIFLEEESNKINEQQKLKSLEENVLDVNVNNNKETLAEEITIDPDNVTDNIEPVDIIQNDVKESNLKTESTTPISKSTTTNSSNAQTIKKTVPEKPNVNVTTPVAPQTTPVVVTPPVVTEQTIKLNNNGTIITLNLEDYIIGVVAAEMPASFHVEALKSQAIAARTFALKKVSEGVTLQNSTAHQVYKNESALRTLWGSSYNTYYNKIKGAIDSTKGLVMTYNGKYIDALFHSMSNSKTELPRYVWGNNVAYLQSVSSNWDTKVSNFKVDTNISYSTLSTKLGFTINSNTEFTILSQTVSGRVDSIKIGEKTYSGVALRTALGLRSTDFKFIKNANDVTVTTLRLWSWCRYESIWSK